MRIALFDPYKGKFTTDMERWWLAHGYEVRRDTYYDPDLVLWADVVFFHTCDNNIKSATHPEAAIMESKFGHNIPIPWDMHEMDLTGKKIICQPIDIEVWQGHHADAKIWDLVTDCVFIAPHIRDIMMADSRPQESNMNIHVIPFGVDLNRWTFKERQPGFNIAVVAEAWVSKGVDYVLQIAYKLRQLDSRYNISWLGKWHDYHWEEAYARDFIEYNDLPITFVDWAEDVDSWLEDKHYLLLGSKKEAFSFATAEAMAKGIKPVLHAFYGSRELWPGITWSGIEEAVDRITEDLYESESYRRYLQERGYTLDAMMQRYEEVIHG